MDAVRFGRGIRALRQRRAWRQLDLATAAGLSRGPIARIEQGRADRVTVATLDRVARALGAKVSVRLDAHGEELDRLLDAGHARLVERVVRELSGMGWSVATEVTFSIWGERGSIDVLAYRPTDEIVLVVEVKTVVPDIGSMLMTLDRKARLAAQVAAARGWRTRTTARLLVIAESTTTRRRLGLVEATLMAAFADRGRSVRRWLRRPLAGSSWSGLWILPNESQPILRRRKRVRRIAVTHATGEISSRTTA